VVTLRTFLEQWPDDEHAPESRYLLAITLRDLGRRPEALATTLALLQDGNEHQARDPKRWAYWQRRTGNQLANDFFEAGDTLNAHAIYSGLLTLSPEPAWRLPASYQLGLCYERLGQIEQARALYQTIVDSAAPTAPPGLAELVRMAAWRLEHLVWREQTARQMSALFDTTTGKQAGPITVSPPPLPRHDSTRNPAGTSPHL
jgi:tetratricopeptide (TPR) repeat protein